MGSEIQNHKHQKQKSLGAVRRMLKQVLFVLPSGERHIFLTQQRGDFIFPRKVTQYVTSRAKKLFFLMRYSIRPVQKADV